MASWSTSTTSSSSQQTSRSKTEGKSTTKNVLDQALMNTILSGLAGQMTKEEIAQYAQSLLEPQKNAALEAARQQYETAKLTREQEIEDIAAALAGNIEKQNRVYRQSMADVETAAIARGMGRSSYTLDRLAQQGDALSRAVAELTQESDRKSEQLRRQITQAAEQSEKTQARVNADYAGQLAAKIQELTQEQRREANTNYLTAVSAAMGKETSSKSQTTGESRQSSTTTTSKSSGRTGSSSSKKKKEEEPVIDAVSMAAPSIRQMTGR